ncbi:NAD(P)/FAD-dependent oxidoreductase [Putridiphycobacter roseus]|uniref:NAD(P)/FAD-dependent oxidoreductase n=1 Tax=Putridiphycobacter roseus TaxID=2219161 RepID=A0A2W1MYN8_9FLAO|nr:FAD/NAD(P)-binding oxidoreductase [Putridiphycobacter roseus]PZE17309.1 NAD(P)/FAD-dependent oxidoreductase [Putridiphycobacter roseus]
MEHVVIIGNGISGVTAARHIRKLSDQKITIISAESKYFFSRTALMYVFMGHMKFEHIQPYEAYFWKKNRLDLVQDFVEKIDVNQKKVYLAGQAPIAYSKLIIATGSKPNKFGWPGQDLDGVQGLYSKQDLELIEENAKNAKTAVLIGGGLIGVELAEMLITRGIKVIFLVRENKFWGGVLPAQEAALIGRHIEKHHVDLRYQEELEEIIGDENGRVKEIRTKKGEIIPCEIVGLTAGVSPNINMVAASDVETARGIMVNEFLETSVPDVYAIGDCAQFHTSINGRKNIEQVWYTGRIMGETVAQTICGNRLAYNPGPWFNSAKFFDIEYQTYGWVFAQLKEGEEEFYWEHEKGEIAMHLVWDKNTHEFKGINSFGIRLRHDLFDKWLNEKASIQTVMSLLKSANFDPEFYKLYEKEIITQFNTVTSFEISLKPRLWWQKLMTS